MIRAAGRSAHQHAATGRHAMPPVTRPTSPAWWRTHFYAIEIDEALAMPHESPISEDKWVEVNVRLIEELGPESYLRDLLSILKGASAGPSASVTGRLSLQFHLRLSSGISSAVDSLADNRADSPQVAQRT